MDIKPWLVVIVEPEKDFLFFDDYMQAVEWAQAYPELTTVVCTAIAVYNSKIDRKLGQFDGEKS